MTELSCKRVLKYLIISDENCTSYENFASDNTFNVYKPKTQKGKK